MRRHLASLSLMAGLQLAACQGGNLAGAGTIEIEGTLVLRGNEPFAQAVVVVSSSEQWTLSGVQRADIENHQNQTVRVKGQVVHEATPLTVRPATLRVQELSPLTKPAPASPK